MSLSQPLPPQTETPTDDSLASSTRAPIRRLVGKIKEVGYLGFIQWASADDDHRTCVHLAQFHHPTIGACQAYVKLYQANIGKQLANEITNFLCAHALGVPQPEHAFIANIPLARLRNPPGWIKAEAKMHATLPAFCTTRLDGESAAVRVPESQMKLLIEEVAKWEHLENAVALDENIAQTDRHLNNLIRLSRKRYAVIDGGRLAYDDDGGEHWSPVTLDALRLYRNRLSERIWNHKPEQKCVDKMLVQAPRHAGLIDTVHDELRYWWNHLLEPADAQAFERFLAQRSLEVEALLRKRYRMLV